MIKVEWVTDNKYLIGDSEYGYYYCGISFYQKPVERGDLTEDDMQDICEAVRVMLLNVLQDKEEGA